MRKDGWKQVQGMTEGRHFFDLKTPALETGYVFFAPLVNIENCSIHTLYISAAILYVNQKVQFKNIPVPRRMYMQIHEIIYKNADKYDK